MTTLAQLVTRAEDEVRQARILSDRARRLSSHATTSEERQAAREATDRSREALSAAEARLEVARFEQEIEHVIQRVQTGREALAPVVLEAARGADGSIDPDLAAALTLQRAGVPVPSSWSSPISGVTL